MYDKESIDALEEEIAYARRNGGKIIAWQGRKVKVSQAEHILKHLKAKQNGRKDD